MSAALSYIISNPILTFLIGGLGLSLIFILIYKKTQQPHVTYDNTNNIPEPIDYENSENLQSDEIIELDNLIFHTSNIKNAIIVSIKDFGTNKRKVLETICEIATYDCDLEEITYMVENVKLISLKVDTREVEKIAEKLRCVGATVEIEEFIKPVKSKEDMIISIVLGIVVYGLIIIRILSILIS